MKCNGVAIWSDGITIADLGHGRCDLFDEPFFDDRPKQRLNVWLGGGRHFLS